jgi:hypothetical protein
MPNPSPPAARLDFQHATANVKRVVVDDKQAKDWINDHVVEVPASGFKKVEVTYEHEGRTSRTVQYIGFASGVIVQLQDHNGALVAAQIPGKRCARVEGSNQEWMLCDDVDRRIPIGKTFDLECSNPVDLGANNQFWINSEARPASADFVPTLPGLYRAHYQSGQISISYEPNDCAGSVALEP